MSISHTLAITAISSMSVAKVISGAALAKGAALFAVIAVPAQIMRSRQALNQIAGMSDTELRDIGLTRGDVTYARNMPLTSDPTLELAHRAEGRRSH